MHNTTLSLYMVWVNDNKFIPFDEIVEFDYRGNVVWLTLWWTDTLFECFTVMVGLIVYVWLGNELDCLIVWLGVGNPSVMIEKVNYDKPLEKWKGKLNWIKINP